MATITVTGDGPTYQVEVRAGAARTSHSVTVPATLAPSLGWALDATAALVHSSFEFLLEREPATSILRRFSLDVIGDYFPEYRREMERLAPDADPSKRVR